MIIGVVNTRHEATIRLPVRNATGQESVIEVILDTGFNGSLTLPLPVIMSLGLAWRTRGQILLANGTTDVCDMDAATVLWDGSPRPILVEEADTDPLIGMALLYGYDVRMAVIASGRVSLVALP